MVTLLLAAVLAAQIPPPTCGDALALQVRLDRNGFSPGEIDGAFGPNVRRALQAFRDAKGLQSASDCDVWNALGGDSEPSTTTYTITDADAEGPFTPSIPRDLVAQAGLPQLGYRSLIERLAERFHASPKALERLNAGTQFQPGNTITVPNVTPFDDRAKLVRDTSVGSVTLEVTREGTLRVLGASDAVLFAAPVSSGSQHDPLPAGNWKVTAVAWHPPFHYNPDLFWDAKPADAKSKIQPGPNNPVGVVWIDINVEHYGLHGTPEPSRIGHTQSHGCVRMTNWDAARVATLVAVGTPVVFK